MNTEIPWASRSPPLVRAVTMKCVAKGAPITTAFWPFRIQPAPSFLAVVVTAARL